MEELDLRDLYYMVRKRLWLVIVLFVLATVTAGLLSVYVITPEYKTSATIILGKVENAETEYISSEDIRLNKELIGTFAEVAKSDKVLDEVVRRLSFEVNQGEIYSNLSVSLRPNSQIIEMTIRGTSPEKISVIVNTTADVLMEIVTELMTIDNVNILDYSRVPSGPDSPNLKMNVAIAGVLGIMLALFIIFMLEMFDHTIKVPEDVTRHLELPILGMIPEHE